MRHSADAAREGGRQSSRRNLPTWGAPVPNPQAPRQLPVGEGEDTARRRPGPQPALGFRGRPRARGWALLNHGGPWRPTDSISVNSLQPSEWPSVHVKGLRGRPRSLHLWQKGTALRITNPGNLAAPPAISSDPDREAAGGSGERHLPPQPPGTRHVGWRGAFAPKIAAVVLRKEM